MADPLFEDISPEQNVIEVESLCMNCHEQGVSRFLLTRIPHFKDIVIAAFECPHCGYHNNEVQSASAIGEKGLKLACSVKSQKDLDRQVVISEHATILIPDIELEVPTGNKKGYLSNIEGVLTRIKADLAESQPQRQAENNTAYQKIAEILSSISLMLDGSKKFEFILDDPSGNSYIESLHGISPSDDPAISLHHYKQTTEQLQSMGYYDSSANNTEQVPDSVYEFEAKCYSCGSLCATRMHMIDVPYFREVIIMATTCDECGYKTNEVRGGGAISEKGKTIRLKLQSAEDMNRDVLKAETCSVEIPEINLHLTTGSLGGRFTTVEGLLRQIKTELQDKVPFITGDSAAPERKATLDQLLEDIEKICCLELLPATIILDDPLGSSYVQNLCAPDEDPQLVIEEYERSFEQNEEYGLNDIKVENY